MKIQNIIPLIALAVVGSACERTLNFSPSSGEADYNMVINAVAVADTSFKVFLSEPVRTDQSVIPIYTGESTSDDDPLRDYVSNTNYLKTSVSDADVTVEVNGQTSYNMRVNYNNMTYTGSYIPREGDRIEVTAVRDGKQLRAAATVPPKPSIEIVSYEVLAENPYREMSGLAYDTDTIMRLTCRIRHTSETQYYRLRVRSERDLHRIYRWRVNSEWYERHEYIYGMQDVFFSTDNLFVDQRLTKNFGGWPAFFSNVFDTTLMGSGDYTFTIDSPKVPHNQSSWNTEASHSQEPIDPIPARVMVELQAITSDYYHYLKSAELYRVTTADAYSEPVHIYSNAQNGWGILGALSYDRHFVEFGD